MKNDYSIAGVNIRFIGTDVIAQTEFSNEFEANFTTPDVIYNFIKTEYIPKVKPEYSQETVGVIQSDDAEKYVVCNLFTKEPYLAICEKNNEYIIEYIDEKQLINRSLWYAVDLYGMFLKNDRIVFHSSYIDCNGSGILFCGKSGIGKSTQAELWRQFAGAEIINGDKSVIYSQNGKAVVSSLPVAGTSGICKNRILPLKAVIVLEQGKENKLTKLNPIEALTSMMKSCIIDTWKNGETDKCISVLAQILKTAEVYKFSCLPDKSAVDTLRNILNN